MEQEIKKAKGPILEQETKKEQELILEKITNKETETNIGQTKQVSPTLQPTGAK